MRSPLRKLAQEFPCRHIACATYSKAERERPRPNVGSLGGGLVVAHAVHTSVFAAAKVPVGLWDRWTVGGNQTRTAR